MNDDETSPHVRVVMLAGILVLVGVVGYAVADYADARQQRLDACDEQFGEDGWVFVEQDIPRWQRVLYLGSPPVECVSIDSPRAEDCVLTNEIADYNTRCAER